MEINHQWAHVLDFWSKENQKKSEKIEEILLAIKNSLFSNKNASPKDLSIETQCSEFRKKVIQKNRVLSSLKKALDNISESPLEKETEDTHFKQLLQELETKIINLEKQAKEKDSTIESLKKELKFQSNQHEKTLFSHKEKIIDLKFKLEKSQFEYRKRFKFLEQSLKEKDERYQIISESLQSEQSLRQDFLNDLELFQAKYSLNSPKSQFLTPQSKSQHKKSYSTFNFNN